MRGQNPEEKLWSIDPWTVFWPFDTGHALAQICRYRVPLKITKKAKFVF